MKLVITASILVSDGPRNIDANTNQTESAKDELQRPSLGNPVEKENQEKEEVPGEEEEEEAEGGEKKEGGSVEPSLAMRKSRIILLHHPERDKKMAWARPKIHPAR